VVVWKCFECCPEHPGSAVPCAASPPVTPSDSLGTLTTAATVGHPLAVDAGDIGLTADCHVAAAAGAGAGGARDKCPIAGCGSSTWGPGAIDQGAISQCAGLAGTNGRSGFIDACWSAYRFPTTATGTGGSGGGLCDASSKQALTAATQQHAPMFVIKHACIHALREKKLMYKTCHAGCACRVRVQRHPSPLSHLAPRSTSRTVEQRRRPIPPQCTAAVSSTIPAVATASSPWDTWSYRPGQNSDAPAWSD